MTPLPRVGDTVRRAPNNFPFTPTEETCSYGNESVRRTERKRSPPVGGHEYGQGVEFHDGRVSARVDHDGVGEAIWRVAAASAQLAHAGVVFQPRRRGRGGDFEQQVATVLGERSIGFESHVPIEGESGRTHHATFLVPSRWAAIEPVLPWYLVADFVYGKVGDLSPC